MTDYTHLLIMFNTQTAYIAAYNIKCRITNFLHCVICERNIFGNKQSPSRDIARSFAIQESISFYFYGSFNKPSDRYITIYIFSLAIIKGMVGSYAAISLY